MTHQSVLGDGTPLADFHATFEDHWKLLLRIVQVNEDGKLTLPVREPWCTTKEATDPLSFTIYKASCLHDAEEDPDFTLAEANEEMTSGFSWICSLRRQYPFLIAGSGKWYVTEILRTKPSVWRKVQTEHGKSYYALGEKNVRAWLERDGGEVLVRDSENDWDCISCPSSDEESSKHDQNADDQDEEDRDGGAQDREDHHEEGLAGKDSPSADPARHDLAGGDLDEDMKEDGVSLTEAQTAPNGKRKFTLVECEADEYGDGYDGDVEKGRTGKKRLSNGVRISKS